MLWMNINSQKVWDQIKHCNVCVYGHLHLLLEVCVQRKKSRLLHPPHPQQRSSVFKCFDPSTVVISHCVMVVGFQLARSPHPPPSGFPISRQWHPLCCWSFVPLVSFRAEYSVEKPRFSTRTGSSHVCLPVPASFACAFKVIFTSHMIT